jgi:hypothetical protein
MKDCAICGTLTNEIDPEEGLCPECLEEVGTEEDARRRREEYEEAMNLLYPSGLVN